MALQRVPHVIGQVLRQRLGHVLTQMRRLVQAARRFSLETFARQPDAASSRRWIARTLVRRCPVGAGTLARALLHRTPHRERCLEQLRQTAALERITHVQGQAQNREAVVGISYPACSDRVSACLMTPRPRSPDIDASTRGSQLTGLEPAQLATIAEAIGCGGRRRGRPWTLPLATRLELVCTSLRTNRELAILFAISASQVHRILVEPGARGRRRSREAGQARRSTARP